MKTYDSTYIWTEIQAAERWRDERLASLEGLVSGYTSPFHKGYNGALDVVGHDYNPENHAYEYCRRTVAEMAYNSPRVQLSSRTYGMDSSVKELEYGINQLVLDRKDGERYRLHAYDAMFARATSLTTFEDHPYIKGGKWTVKTRLSPRHYFFDPAALSRREALYEGHRYIQDLDELLEEAKEGDGGWDLEAVEMLAANSGVEEYRKMQTVSADIPDRGEVVIYQVWWRDLELDKKAKRKDGYNGTLFTLGVTLGDSEGGNRDIGFLKPPEPYYGPPSGPYATMAFYAVPDDPWGLAPLVAIEGQVRDLNRHARGVSRAASKYKRLILVDDISGSLAEQVESADHDTIISIDKINKDSIIPAEVGGVTEQNLAYLQLAHDRLARNSGMGDPQRGMPTKGATATAEAIAEQNSDTATDFMKGRFQEFVKEDLEKDLWYMWKDSAYRLVLGRDAAKDLGVVMEEELGTMPPEAAMEAINSGMVMGKGDSLEFHPDTSGLAFETLALEIEPMSMERSSEGLAQRRALEMFQLVTQVAQLAITPAGMVLDLETLMDAIGDAMNLPNLADIIRLDVAAQLAQMPMMAPQSPQSGQNPLAGSKQPAPVQSEGRAMGAQLGGLVGMQ